MDGTRGHSPDQLCPLVWRSSMGFYCESFRFEGGGRQKILGLNRTGKSCRLRWVNYLHPGLKRGKMNPQEEKLVLELHAKWGNRWSRIARKLPGRTDNEIKNYWRTYMRKKAQESKKAMSPSLSSSNSSSPNTTTVGSSSHFQEAAEASFYDTGGNEVVVSGAEQRSEAGQGGKGYYSMDDIWTEIEKTIAEPVCDGFREEVCNFSTAPIASPTWEYCPDTLWKMMDAEEECKMFLPYDYGTLFLTG